MKTAKKFYEIVPFSQRWFLHRPRVLYELTYGKKLVGIFHTLADAKAMVKKIENEKKS